MNHKLVLNLITIPTVSGFMLAMPLLELSAQAIELNSTKSASCSVPIHTKPESTLESIETTGTKQKTAIANRLVASAAIEIPIEYPAQEYSTQEHPMADFTIAESDAAVELFGCDCMACINTLRQIRSQSLEQLVASNNQGHCWSSMQQRVSPEEMQNVLETLDVEEAK